MYKICFPSKIPAVGKEASLLEVRGINSYTNVTINMIIRLHTEIPVFALKYFAKLSISVLYGMSTDNLKE